MSADSIMSRVIDAGDGIRYVPHWDKRFDRFITREDLSRLDRYDWMSFGAHLTAENSA